MSERVQVIAELRPRADRLAEFRVQAEAMAVASRDEPGCLSYELYVDPADQARWLVVEEWADRAALDAHLAAPHLAEALARTAELLTGEPRLKILGEPAR
ncbi:putative quinol monooxygenase [Kitasatospora viridis]|uniref:Quinol monooxygenase YgiN n=1 Tax=Kitasatospora viridis TaxID=281105 RepID=A0A561UJQ9_9ACTN|nr:putative quinol monooxygenase [Kitasatospora viridis]TWF99600.1 quinol monooxygenase YgiN [Kitasatospora viridis]